MVIIQTIIWIQEGLVLRGGGFTKDNLETDRSVATKEPQYIGKQIKQLCSNN